MIRITDETHCCGCGACVQICPQKCVILVEDERGFCYPQVASDNCINCGLCEKVCPVLSKKEIMSPLKITACKNSNEEQRLNSSSGGVFRLFAEITIQHGGVVFGAKFDENWRVVHDYTDSLDGLIAFQGSKYVQSIIGDTYLQAKSFLEEGRQVLYSGTPCQIAGLKSFLRKKYDNLLTIEIICHGVPSPKIWRDYLDYLRRLKDVGTEGNAVLPSLNGTALIDYISFRDKHNGWGNYGFVVRFSDAQKKTDNSVFSTVNASIKTIDIRESHKENIYMQAYLSNAILRPICFSCVFKSGRSCADISLGDFWTIDSHAPEMNDDKGVTIVYILSEKGLKFFNLIRAEKKELDNRADYNSAFHSCATIKYPIDKFWVKYGAEGFDCMEKVNAALRPSLLERLLKAIRVRMYYLINK